MRCWPRRQKIAGRSSRRRQAEVARRAAIVQAERRDARLRLLADDLVTQRGALAAEIADETAVRTRRAEVEAALLAARELESAREIEAAAAAARVSDAQDTWYRLAALAERFGGTASLARERARHLATPPPAGPPGRDPDALEREAAAAREQEAALASALATDRAELAAAGRGGAGAARRGARHRGPPRGARSTQRPDRGVTQPRRGGPSRDRPAHRHSRPGSRAGRSRPRRADPAAGAGRRVGAVSYTHLRAHETPEHLVCRLLLEKKKTNRSSRRIPPPQKP